MADIPILPDVSFVTTDAQQVISDIITGYETAAGGITLAPGDPRRLFLLTLAYIIIQQRQQIDASGKSNLLYYAKGDHLDHLGAFRRTSRLPASSAVTTLRFTLSEVQSTDIGIPQGTRATHDDQLYWRTTQAAVVPTGQAYVDVPAEAMTAGSIGNNIDVGQINLIVDPVPFVVSVSNIYATEGGVDKESDDSYRIRIYQAPAAFSTAGPEEAYVFWSLTANPAISNVSATSPTPSVAEVRPLLDGGIIPDQAILDQVYEALSPATIRPLADRVDVLAPEAVPYDLVFTYYVRRVDQGSLSQIQARVGFAVEEYIDWQRARLGRDIIPDELIYRVRAAGAKRLAITSPVFTKLEPHQVAQEVTVTVVYGGIEDE